MSAPSETIEIYCVKCKARTRSRNITPITLKNGRPATRSTCVERGVMKFHWVVEQILRWLLQFRWLQGRYERRA